MGDRAHHTSPSYKKCHCGADCYRAWDSNPEEPCWGEVHACDEFQDDEGDYYFAHSCEGHRDAYVLEEPYIPEKEEEA